MTMDSKIKEKEDLIDYSVNRSHVLTAKVHVTLTVRSNWWSARETAEEGNFTIANATRNILSSRKIRGSNANLPSPKFSHS